MITFACTSCGRQDLLEKTIDSFLKYNTHPIREYIVIEDSGVPGCNDHLAKKYSHLPFTWIYNEENMGMIKSIDKVYTYIKTPFVFHCEDDWEFYRTGFIEESLEILNRCPEILLVWLREMNDTNGHPIWERVQRAGKAFFCYVSTYYQGVWHGYTTNPGLRRTADKVNFQEIIDSTPGPGQESKISEYYFSKKFYAAILTKGAVRHTGGGRSANNPDDNFEDDEINFECCSSCDLPDACADFGCAIKNGIRQNPDIY